MPRPPRHHRLPRLLAGSALAVLLLAPALPALAPPASAQDPAPSIPGLGPLPEGVTLNYAVGGEIGEVPAGSQLILERIDLDAGESVPGSDAAQILVAKSGSLTLIDDLGLEATLGEGQAFFADAGSASDLRADNRTTVLRAHLYRDAPDPTDDAVMIVGTNGCENDVVVQRGETVTIINTTDNIVRIHSSAIGLDLWVPASSSEVFRAPEDVGEWAIACGGWPSIQLQTDPDRRVSPAAASAGGDTLISSELEPQAEGASLVMLSLAIDPGASIGPVPMAGPTGVYSMASDLTVVRPDRLNASLPSERGVVFPSGMTATLANDTSQTGEVLIIAIVPSELVPELATTSTAGDSAPIEVTLMVMDIYFAPADFTIESDATLVLDASAAMAPHNFQVQALGIDIDIAPGEIKEVVIEGAPGTYDYICNVPGHKEAGMVGRMTITPALAADSNVVVASAPETNSTSLALHDIYFDPVLVTIVSGNTLVLDASAAAAPHNFTIDELGISVDVPPGGIESIVIDAPPGEYDIYCNVPGHQEAGMVATLIVTATTASSQPPSETLDPVAYLPDEDAVEALGLLPLSTFPADSIADTLQMNLDQLDPAAAAAWETGLVAWYFRVDEPNVNYFVSVDVFTNDAAATAVMSPYLSEPGDVAGRTFLEEDSFWDDAIMLDMEIILGSKDTTGIMARHGRVVVSIINVPASVYAAGFVPGLFQAIADPAAGRQARVQLAIVATHLRWVEYVA